MANVVKISIDLNSGSVSIEASDDSLDKIFQRLETFLPSLIDAREQYASTEDVVPLEQENEPDKGETKKLSSKKATVKPPTFKTVNLGLDQTQREAFKTFYEEKKPEGQNQHVLTVIYWLIKSAGKSELSADEVFTGLRTVGETVPKRLPSVLSNLAIDSMITRSGGKFGLHHIGLDFVEKNLPKAAAKK